MLSSVLTGKIMAGISLILLIALLSLGAYHQFSVGLLHSQVKDLTEKNAQLSVENGVLTKANLQMSLTLDTQTEKLNDLADAQKEARVVAEKAINKANSKAATMEAKYAALLNAPRVSDNECADVALRLDQYFKIRQTEAL